MRDAVSAALGEWLGAPGGEVLAAYRERDALRGREVSWEGAGIEPGVGSRGRGRRARQPGRRALTQGERLSLGSGEVSLPARSG